MPGVNVTIIGPNLKGSPIYDVTGGVGQKKSLGVSIDWSTRWRASVGKGGCPSWIDQIVVAKDLGIATRTTVKAPQRVGIASSSFSSRHVVAIMLDEEGNEDARVIYPYVYVAEFHESDKHDLVTGKKIPIADEIWFSQVPVSHPKITEAEGQCNHDLY